MSLHVGEVKTPILISPEKTVSIRIVIGGDIFFRLFRLFREKNSLPGKYDGRSLLHEVNQ